MVGRRRSRPSDSSRLTPAVLSALGTVAALHVARHARRLAEEHVQPQVDGHGRENVSLMRESPSAVVSPITANGQRSRAQSAAKRSTLPGASAST